MAVSTFSSVCRLAVLAIVIANMATSDADGDQRLGENTAFLIPIRAPRVNKPKKRMVERKSLIGRGLRPTSLLRSIGGISSVNNVMSTSESFSTDESFDENEETTCVKGVCTTKKVKTVCKNGVCTNSAAGRALMRMLSGRAVKPSDIPSPTELILPHEAENALAKELETEMKRNPEGGNKEAAFQKAWETVLGGPDAPVPAAKTGRNLSLIRMLSGRAVEAAAAAKDEANAEDMAALMQELDAVLKKAPEDQQEAFAKEWQAITGGNVPEEQPAPAKTGRNLSLIRMLSGRAVEPQKVDVDALVKDMAALLEKVPEDQQEAFEKAWEASMDSNPDEQAPAKTGRSLFNGVIPVGQNMLLFV